MEQNNRETLKGLGLQFFADPAPTEPPADPKPADPQPNPNPAPADPKPADPATGKTYTQEQLNTLMANEKRTARQALLKELGFDLKDEKGYKETVANIKKTLDAGKTQQQLDAEAKTRAEQEAAEERTARMKLEMKVAALTAGVNPEYLEDVITLAQTKVTDTMPADKVFAELKTKYPTFFGESSGGSGTGNPTNPARNKGGNASEGLGQRLAKANKPVAKSSYFKN